MCSTALSLFRGDVLDDAGDGDWLIPHRTRLEETRLGLLEHRLAARMELGAGGEVVAELQALVAQHPLREGLSGLLITALYRDGRQGDALAVYRTVRAHLVDELGVDPGDDLQSLERQVLQHDPVLDAPPRGRREPPATHDTLPGVAAPLVGRDVDLERVAALLAGSRLVTLTGPAGVGKTRLAIEAARMAGRRHTWLARLDVARTADAVIDTIGAALLVHGATEATLIDRLRPHNGLLVLDNCEHIVDEIAGLTARILADAPQLRVLATSQLPLGLDGERVYQLDPLSPADSVDLFARRAAERRASFVLDDDTAGTVDDVCRALDGLPLAIELAAARTNVLSVQEIARRLDDRFALLRDPTSRRPERQRALGAAIAWSHDLLFPDDQRGLWALACFVGGATLEALEHVLAALDVPGSAVLDVVSRLADRSLIRLAAQAGGAVRYDLLDSVRAFALGRMAAAGLTDLARGAHAAWLAGAATLARGELHGPAQARHLAFA